MATVKPVVVIIEDNAKLRRLLRTGLQEHGLDVREAESGQTGLVVAATRKPDLIILDLGLPDVDGTEILRKVREWWSDRPVIVLSGRISEVEKVAALELGADDYITKPFGLPELLARVRAALRRSARRAGPDATTAFHSHGVTIDLLERTVLRDGQPVPLTPNEFRVIAVLIRHAGLLVTTDTLVNELWGPGSSANNRNYLRTYVAALRQKLEVDPARPALILTEAGVGYRLALETARDAGRSSPDPIRDGTGTADGDRRGGN
jgi:two-component system KDP operon response regulator KdpE